MRLLTILLLAACGLGGQTADGLRRAQASHRETMRYLESAARKITEAALHEVSARDRWEPVAEKRREELRRMLGLLPWPQRTPLKVQITGTVDRGDFTIEKLAFESLPKVYVTANLYLPKQRQGRIPAVVYVCGHAYSPHGAKTAYQRHGISFAKNGYVALIIDPIQIAELYALHHGVHSQEMQDWYSRGYSPAGVEVWNAMRAIDYLQTRPEVDPKRIGMTGRSGGAAMTWFTAAVDPRVKAAAPVMGLSTYAANVEQNTQKLHCDCMFPVNGYLHDMVHQAALIAPRPLLMAHGRLDALFPVPGYTAVEESMRKLYTSYGRADAFANIVVETDHKDSDFLREQAIRWFDRFLLGAGDRKLDMSYTNTPDAELAVFPKGAPADARNYRVHEVFLPMPGLGKSKTLAHWERRKSSLLASLRSEVFRAFPADVERPDVRRVGSFEGTSWEELDLEPHAGVHVRMLVRRPGHGRPSPTLLYVAGEAEDPHAAMLLLSNVRDDTAVKAIVYPRGTGEVPWSKSASRDVQRNAMYAGQTIDSMRLWDVMSAASALSAQPGVDAKRVTVMGRGAAGVLSLYAAALNPEIEQVTLIEAPASHLSGPHFLNVLRHTDLPEVTALVAPRRVNFYGRMHGEFEGARQVFGLYGKADHLWTTTSLEGPVLHRYDHGYSSGR